MCVFDSDHLSFLQERRGPEFESIVKHLCNHLPSAFFVTIISFHEQFNGWLKFIARTKEESDLVRGYTELHHVQRSGKSLIATRWAKMHVELRAHSSVPIPLSILEP